MPGKKLIALDEGWKSFIMILIVLSVFIVIYVILHASIKGSKDEKLSEEDKTVVTFILNDTSLTEKARVDSALLYIINVLQPVNSFERDSFLKQYSSLLPYSLIPLLGSISISTSSYFWLNTDFKYLEVIFFSIFGVIANLLYFASESMRKKSFSTSELPVYFAKIFYTPFIVLILILSYKQLTSSGEIQFDNTSVEIIIFSFILGFFSGRAIELLNKVKDILLPGTSRERETAGVLITGEVKIPEKVNKNLLKNVEIVIESTDKKDKVYKTSADSEGKYILGNIEDGIYKIKADLSSNGNHFTDEMLNLKIDASKPVQVVNFNLKEN